MSATKQAFNRSLAEKVFLLIFLPAVFLFYVFYKYPQSLVTLGWIDNLSDIYFLGKSPSFWYGTVYSGIVCYLCLHILFKQKSPYRKGNKTTLSNYQRNKWISIFISQLIFFYILPYILPVLISDRPFFADPITPIDKNMYVYVSRGFTSWTGFAYIFILVPLSVYFFGKRYCSWFCACGNLAEVIGTTTWGKQWVQKGTPRGANAKKWENLQTVFLAAGILYGLILFLDIAKIFSAETLLIAGRYYQDVIVDLIFGALIGIGAYPFFGTRIWCRYGCPLAKGMELFGRHIKTQYQIVANDNCKGLDLCTQVCPMGIPVDSYAHKNKKPIMGSFGLAETSCIGCGGCIDICPTEALSFKEIII